MGQAFGVPVFMANNYIIPAMQIKYFKIDKDAKYISIFIGEGEEPITTCAVPQLGFGFFPDAPPADKKESIIKTIG